MEGQTQVAVAPSVMSMAFPGVRYDPLLHLALAVYDHAPVREQTPKEQIEEFCRDNQLEHQYQHDTGNAIFLRQRTTCAVCGGQKHMFRNVVEGKDVRRVVEPCAACQGSGSVWAGL